MSEYHAAVGLAALTAWPENKARRQRLFEDYLAALARPELEGRIELVTGVEFQPPMSAMPW
jgi:hypothetical protein